jgi:hypothetical protein
MPQKCIRTSSKVSSLHDMGCMALGIGTSYTFVRMIWTGLKGWLWLFLLLKTHDTGWIKIVRGLQQATIVRQQAAGSAEIL